MLKHLSKRLSVALLLVSSATSLVILHADDDAAKAAREKQAKQRLELMQQAIDECKASSDDITSAAALKFGKKPLLRYNDPTRGLGDTTKGLLDAGVWRLGESGRPLALVTLEIYRVEGASAVLCHEMLSLTSKRISLPLPKVPAWTPSGTEFKIAPLPNAPVPAETLRGRLTQMRQFAQKFSVQETLDGNEIECRLLAQPIDRYAEDKAGIQDGAIFVFANGTNPEVGLIFETNGKDWNYGLFRLSSAAIQAKLDDKVVFESRKVGNFVPTAPYAGVCHPIMLPE